MFESIMLISFLYACYWAWKRQVYVYPCYVCGKKMRHNEAACSERCVFELYRDSEVVADYHSENELY